MDDRSQETLRSVEENDAGLTTLFICYGSRDGRFTSSVGDDYSILGAAIEKNTHLTYLLVDPDDAVALDARNNEFYDGLKQNSSIHKLTLRCQSSYVTCRVGRKILEAYQANNNLTEFCTLSAGQRYGGDLIAQTLRRSTNLKQIGIVNCGLTDGQLLPMIGALREHRSLEKLDLIQNNIGNAGCETIATLLSDPISNLHTLHLANNLIGDDGAATLANGLANNTKLRELYLAGNPINQSSVDAFKKLLCNKSSINSIYSSNHTLQTLQGISQRRGNNELDSLLKMNKCTNKSHVAIKKILKFHPNIDMEPFFEWNMEGEGERDLKALPHVLSWFDRAREAVANDGGGESYNTDERKLSAMYQFAQAMPLMFIPPAHTKEKNVNKREKKDTSKRKRDTMGWGEQFYRTYKIKSSKWGQNIGSG